MESFLFLLGGVLLGALLTYLLGVIRLTNTRTVALPVPDISNVQCLPATSQIRITGTIDPTPPGVQLVAFHVASHDDPAHTPGATPDAGAIQYPPNLSGNQFQIDHPHPQASSNLTGPPDLVQVWAEYKVFTKDGMSFSCAYGGSGSGSGSGFGRGSEMAPSARVVAVTAAAAEQLEATPRDYRVSLAAPAAGAAGPTAALAGTPEAVLHYAPEASTPVDPTWRGRGESGPVREWTLCLLHRNGGFGAVLSALCVVGGREVRVTWVTSDWRFHAPNRLTCESEEAGGAVTVVRPA